MTVLSLLGPARFVIPAAYVVLSATSFVMYGMDKSAAERGGWRTPEITLHLLSLAGGWPGALIGQQVFRHKTRKQPFRAIFWCTAIANCAAVAWLLSALPGYLAAVR
jgi:uncharacterized membrane protein YsdA (DUF1294 family)